MQKTFEDAAAKVVAAVGYDRALALANTPGLNVAVIDCSLAASNGLDALRASDPTWCAVRILHWSRSRLGIGLVRRAIHFGTGSPREIG